MDKSLFDDLRQSLKEAVAIRKGQAEPSRRFVVGAMDVRQIRERTQLSQEDFARAIRVSVRTLQNWEQGRRHPTGPAAALLKIVSVSPELAVRALHG